MKNVNKILLCFLLGILMIILLVSSLSLFSYSKWKDEFELNIVEENFSENVMELSEDVQIRITDFVNSEENTDFMEFSVAEMSGILDYVMNSDLEGISFDSVYIEPSDGTWNIYIKGRVDNFKLPWISLLIVKDDIESAEFYIKAIKIGNLNIPSFVEEKLLIAANKGVSEAILLFNENLFSKRYLQNISLFEDKVVIKGILY
jgi:hypothetical protein